MGLCCEMEKYIDVNCVSVNGKVVCLGDCVEVSDVICVDGYVVKIEDKVECICCVFMYNKLEGELCICKDFEGCCMVFDCLLCVDGECWIVVGWLDINIVGLMFFINDGEFVNCLMYLSYEVECEYLVWVFGEVINEMLCILIKGVEFEDGLVKFLNIKFMGGEGINCWFNVMLIEGCNCEVCCLW